MSELSETHTYRILDTPTLIRANKQAIMLKQNRSVTHEFTNLLDPFGTHLIGFHMDHVNYEGTPGIRCLIYCKMASGKSPEEVWIDITHKEFLSLSTVTAEGVEEDIKIIRAAS